ncbi:cathepsin d-like aspartic protease [Plakobranchus ocellatus]|uniref:Cathepsin d-like aspartic protease n=1 Tax=Plakobranchus ocellatus TaxID=259542 RepID=A0AAV4CXW6_9GAST|nr:cathepsin d-like aspartic protease [Plakobranchus ocellatus]
MEDDRSLAITVRQAFKSFSEFTALKEKRKKLFKRLVLGQGSELVSYANQRLKGLKYADELVYRKNKRPLTPYVAKSEKLASFSQRKPFRLHASLQENGNPIHDSPPVSTSEIILWNLTNAMHYGIVGIGARGQVFKMLFDTCSSPMWITASLDELRLPSYHKNGKYDSSSTNTNRGKPFSVSYSANNVTGTWSEDVVTLGDIVVPSQVFGEATFVSDIFDSLNIDGVVGLGFRDIFKRDKPNVFDNMVSQGLVQAPIFSFYMNRLEAGGRQSRLTLGGVNPEYYTGDFTYVNLTAPNKWQFKIDRVQLFSGMEIFSENGCQGEMDSTTTLIIGPRMDVIPLNIKLGANLVNMPGPYEMRKTKKDASMSNEENIQVLMHTESLQILNALVRTFGCNHRSWTNSKNMSEHRSRINTIGRLMSCMG